MAQWRQLLKLDPALKSRVIRLYERKFPLEVRRCLSDWIESQDWSLAAADEATARTCFQTLLLKLDELIKESLYNNNTLLGPDFSLPKDYLLNVFEHCPLDMAVILSDCLKGEKMILDSHTVNQLLHCSSTVTEQNQTDLDNKVGDLENQIKKTKEEIKVLEKLELICKTWESQVEQINGLATAQMQQQCLNQANFIMTKTQEVYGQISKSVNLADEIVQTLISAELPEWKHRQQMSCIGNPVSTIVDHLKKWFTAVAEILLQIRQQLTKLQEQSSRHQISDVSGVIQQIDTFTKSLLIKLMQNALVVEKQPVMFSQTHRPLVLKTGVLFTLKLRFLVNLSCLKYGCLVRAEFDKDVEEVETIKGFRQFEFTTNDTKVLELNKQKGGLVAEWDMLIKEDKTKNKRSNESPIRVTEELHVIKFSTELRFADLKCQVEASSLPVVVVSSSSQAPSAWATVMWYNLLSSTEPRSLSVFVEPPPLSWEQLSQALSWQFISAGDRELNEDQLYELKLKIVDDPDELVSWSKFSHQKEGLWIWIDGILDLIEKHLKELWRDGSVMGFVNKEKARVLLQNKQSGNFLLRFSESNREGAITFSWVEHRKQVSIVHAIEPFTKDELSKMSLADHINQYRLKKSPTNPLVYLYPDIPKDNAFGRYYKPCEIIKPTFPYVKRTYVCEGDCPTPSSSPPKNTELDMDLDSMDLPTAQIEQSFEELKRELFSGVLLYNPESFDMDLCDILDDSNTI